MTAGHLAGPAPYVGPDAGLRADLRVTRPAFTLDVSLEARPGEVLALLGPNGAGKSTALRVLAGLLPSEPGRVVLDGTVLDDGDGRRVVPPERRPVGVVFQDYLLFPHLSARENVAFGLRARGVPRARALAVADAWMTRVGLAAEATARPSALSGGQAQRVALARALATSPRLLLLDEPLAALDASTRVEVRAELGRHLQSFDGVAVVVTHDPLDAMVLADRLVVVEDGQVVQQGSPAVVARHPRTDYVARLVGLNLHRGRAQGSAVTLPTGATITVAEPPGVAARDVRDLADGAGREEVFVAFSPSAVSLFPQRPSGSPRNAWLSRVASVEQHGATVRVALDGPVPALADVTPAAVAELTLVPGAQVWAVLKATEARAYPA